MTKPLTCRFERSEVLKDKFEFPRELFELIENIYDKFAKVAAYEAVVDYALNGVYLPKEESDLNRVILYVAIPLIDKLNASDNR